MRRWQATASGTSLGTLLGIKTLLGAFVFLTIADLLFVLGYTGLSFPGQHYIAEPCYTVFFTLILGILFRQFVQAPKYFPWVVRIGLLCLFAIFFCLQVNYVVVPLETSMPMFSLLIRINYLIYTLVTSAVAALWVVLSILTLNFFDLFFLQSLGLCLVCDFSLRYQLALVHYDSSSPATAGWAIGMTGLFSSVFYAA